MVDFIIIISSTQWLNELKNSRRHKMMEDIIMEATKETTDVYSVVSFVLAKIIDDVALFVENDSIESDKNMCINCTLDNTYYLK